jgi:protein-tyrosine phosphatase
MMRILLVCTGNICRSPIGEFLLRRYLEGTGISVASAGTHGLVNRPMDKFSNTILRQRGITETADFRSRRLTTPIAKSSDLILCFEQMQRRESIQLAPTMTRKTFAISHFVSILQHLTSTGQIRSTAPEERLSEILMQPLDPRLPTPNRNDIPDPFGQPFEVFADIAERIEDALHTIAQTIRG